MLNSFDPDPFVGCRTFLNICQFRPSPLNDWQLFILQLFLLLSCWPTLPSRIIMKYSRRTNCNSGSNRILQVIVDDENIITIINFPSIFVDSDFSDHTKTRWDCAVRIYLVKLYGWKNFCWFKSLLTSQNILRFEVQFPNLRIFFSPYKWFRCVHFISFYC